MLFRERISNNSAKRKESDVIEVVAKHALVETITTESCDVKNFTWGGKHISASLSSQNQRVKRQNQRVKCSNVNHVSPDDVYNHFWWQKTGQKAHKNIQNWWGWVKAARNTNWSVSSPQNEDEENKNMWIFLMCVIVEENPDKNGKKLI